MISSANEIQTLVDDYWNWLKNKTLITQINEWVEIATPYLDRHNDYIQIYAKKDGEGFLLTDDGYTISDLAISGCKIDTPKRQEILKTILNGFGVIKENDSFTVKANTENFSLKKHNLIQAMLAVDDMFYLSSRHVLNLFFDDVASWLTNSEIRFTPNIKFVGKSGYDHNFDFAIPSSKDAPERLIRAINQPNRNAATSFIQAWTDTKETRSSDSSAIAILNDQNKGISSSVKEAFKNYDIKHIDWSKKEVDIEMLAA